MNPLNSFSKKKKCILISPPENGKCCTRGVLSLASFLESKGYPAGVVPLAESMRVEDISSEKIEAVLSDVIRENDPLMIGVSCLTADYHTCKDVLRICKQLNENIVTLMGGIHPTFLDQDCIALPFVDIVVRGEGEWTLLELIQALENGGFHPPYGELHRIKGITFKENGQVIRTPERPLGDLNELPPLNFGLLRYEFVREAYSYGMMSRGCAFNCTFCADNRFWKGVRRFPVSRIIHEMETLEQVYKSPMVAIEDNMVYLGSEQFSELCREIKQRKITLGPQFYVLTRTDCIIDSQGMKDMEGSGIRNVVLGIETGSPKVLKMMNKKTSPETIISGCEKLTKYGLISIGLWMIGHPGDSAEESEHSLELLRHLLDKGFLSKANFSYFTPWPGTRFFEDMEVFGIEILKPEWSDWNFRSKTGGKREPVCQLKGFSAEEMEVCYKKAQKIIDQYSARPFWEPASESDTVTVSFETLNKSVKAAV